MRADASDDVHDRRVVEIVYTLLTSTFWLPSQCF